MKSFYTKAENTFVGPLHSKEERAVWFSKVKPAAEALHRLTCCWCYQGLAACKVVRMRNGDAYLLCYRKGTPQYDEFMQEQLADLISDDDEE